MDYDNKVREMLLHLAQNPSGKNANTLVRACGFGIAGTMSMIEDRETVQEALKLAFQAIWIETLAMQHPAIARAAALPVADERLGERVCLAVMRKPGNVM